MLRKALPIRYILLGAFLVAVLLPAIVITSLAFYEASSSLKTEITRDMTTRASSTAEEIDRMMFERMQNVVSWSQLEIMQELRISDVDKRLSKFLSDIKESYQDVYVELYVTDSQGNVIASSDIRKVGSNIKTERPWLRTYLSRSQIRLSSIENDQLPIKTTIFNVATDEPVGQLVAIFNWQQVRNVLNTAISGRSAAGLFAADGTLISTTALWAKTQASNKISSSALADGYQSFNGFGWRVELIQSKGQALTPVRKMGYIFLVLMFVTLLLTTSIAIPVSRSITTPITRLTAFARDFFKNPGTKLPALKGPAEINTMSEAFTKMIEDLERSRENLTRAAKLAVAGEMAAAMSHEVRTPLGILRSSAQVLMREPSLSEEGKEVCGFIISETERLNRLVSTLLDSARPRQPNFSAENLSELAGQAVAMLKMQAQKKEITLSVNAPTPVIAICDAEQMTQVLLNLVLNAIQILPEKGKIEVSISQSADHALIQVQDNGPGIPEHLRDQIFDPFFTKRAGGIGLGLAVVRQIVLAHRGNITANMGSMQGAEFRILLPLSGAENT
jgi:signal transduction histidine kinase